MTTEKGCNEHLCVYRFRFRTKQGRNPRPEDNECYKALCPLNKNKTESDKK